MYEEILKEIDAAYEKKINEFRALAQSYRKEVSSKINLSKKDIIKEAETKSEVAP